MDERAWVHCMWPGCVNRHIADYHPKGWLLCAYPKDDDTLVVFEVCWVHPEVPTTAGGGTQ